jgi:1-acyl-sn-glycerol-3-phosphate acyltransferase
MFAFLRAFARMHAILISGSVLYAIYLPTFFFLQRRSPRAAAKWRSFMYGKWARSLAWSFGLDVTYVGPRPSGPFVLVTNHSSYLDIPVLARELDVVFVAKSEVRRWPFVGTLAASVGTIFIQRELRRDTIQTKSAMDAALDDGRSVAFFPEGRSTDGKTVHPFKAPLFDGAARKHVPVVAAAIRYRTLPPAPPAEEIVCWGDDTPFTTHAWRVLKLPKIEAIVSLAPARIESDRKALAAALHRDTLERFDALKDAE